MTCGNYYNFNNTVGITGHQPTFKSDTISGVPKPIEAVSKTIESGVDTFEKTIGVDSSKSNKRKKVAIVAGSSVLVLGGLTMLLNPRNSSKVLSNLKKWQNQFDIKMKQSKNNILKTKIFSFLKKSAEKGEKIGNIVFNMNSGKDILFKNLCTKANKQYPKWLQDRAI